MIYLYFIGKISATIVVVKGTLNPKEKPYKNLIKSIISIELAKAKHNANKKNIIELNNIGGFLPIESAIFPVIT